MPQPLVCSACLKDYSTKGNLAKHLRENPVCRCWSQRNGHIYDLVQRGTFPNTNDLLKHISSADASLDCRYCSKTFANPASLQKHRRTSVICDKWRQHDLLENAARVLSED